MGSYIYENLGHDLVFFVKGGLLIVAVGIIALIYIKVKAQGKNKIMEIR